jgi:hypothetical protein
MSKKLLALTLLSLGVYTNSIAQEQTPAPVVEVPTPVQQKSPVVVITASYGLAYRLAEVATNLPSNLKDAVSDLKSGSYFDTNLYVLLKGGQYGIGLKYNQFNSNSSYIQIVQGIPNNLTLSPSSQSFKIDVNQKITFIGPSMLFNYSDNKTGVFSSEIALGYMGLVNEESNALIGNFVTSGSTLGLAFGADYHFKISENFLIGPQLKILVGAIRELKLETPDGRVETIKLDKEPEGLGRLDLGISAKFRF